LTASLGLMGMGPNTQAWTIMPGVPAGGGPAWSATDNNLMTLSTTTTTNDTALSNDAGGYTGVRGTNSYTGKVYAEFVLTSYATSTPFAVFGFCNSTSNLNGAQCGLQDGNGVTAGDGGNIRWNTGAGNTAVFATGFIAGDIVAVAYDIPNNNMWWRRNRSGTWSIWNNDALADPNTNTNPASIATGAPTGPFYLYFENYTNTSDQIQMKCSSFLGSVPTGFSAC
jgi:hypothetical protein